MTTVYTSKSFSKKICFGLWWIFAVPLCTPNIYKLSLKTWFPSWFCTFSENINVGRDTYYYFFLFLTISSLMWFIYTCI